MQRKTTKGPNGETQFRGDIIRRKDEVFMVDCELTGVSIGTSKCRKMSLLKLFEEPCESGENSTAHAGF